MQEVKFLNYNESVPFFTNIDIETQRYYKMPIASVQIDNGIN